MKKQKTIITVIVMLLLVIGVGIAFWQVMESKRTQSQEETRSKIEEVNDILSKDFDTAYPGTPREVVKMYSRISSCLYNHSLSDSEMESLVKKMRELFDAELLEANPLEEQLEDLRADKEEYDKARRIISSYTVDKNSSVVKKEVDGVEYASLCVAYLVKEGKSYNKSNQQFMLRADEKGNWKILGWQLVTDDDAADQTEEDSVEEQK